MLDNGARHKRQTIGARFQRRGWPGQAICPARTLTLLAAAKPRLLSCRGMVLRAGRSRTQDSESKLDALSIVMTMVSKSVKACRTSDARHPR